MKTTNIGAKPSKPLPARSALNRLDASPRSILDYSKANAEPQEPMPAVLSIISGKKRA